ncbi:hypothetical protein D7Y09_12435 [bacterium 1XD42-1]|jgi:hypothetical protein|nr:hypothetical protein [Oscillospiraceae bacterium]MCI9669893.1 hypothetical protein [Oscillospiraceae bacterium]RKJ53717.1 hypothetical protein D7X25_11715 [bacterium 1XD42-8]RKJ63049.1 hypothetical protein D7Y09_12435 [bacterium 1XD42-1]
MKRIKNLFALLFVMVALCCTGVTAFAQTGAEPSAPPVAYSEPVGNEADKAPIPTSPAEPVEPELPEESPAPQQETAEAQSARGSNIPYYVGAGMAVLVFIGVTIFCKIKGRN